MNTQLRSIRQKKRELYIVSGADNEKYRQMTDAELILACQQRLDGSIDQLLSRHRKTIKNLLYKLAPDFADTSDIAQEVCIRVWHSIGQLRNPAAFRSWLRQIVTNLFYDELRKRPQDIQIVSVDEPLGTMGQTNLHTLEIPDMSRQPEEMLLQRELSVVIIDAMKQIPKPFRQAIMLRDLEGLSYEQIADKTCTEVGTVKSRICRARKRIQQLLKSYVKTCA